MGLYPSFFIGPACAAHYRNIEPSVDPDISEKHAEYGDDLDSRRACGHRRHRQIGDAPTTLAGLNQFADQKEKRDCKQRFVVDAVEAPSE